MSIFIDRWLISKPADAPDKDGKNGKYGIEAQNDALNDIIEKYDEEHYNVRGR